MSINMYLPFEEEFHCIPFLKLQNGLLHCGTKHSSGTRRRVSDTVNMEIRLLYQVVAYRKKNNGKTIKLTPQK